MFQFTCATSAVRYRFDSLHDKIITKINFNNYEIDTLIDLYQKLFKTLEIINNYFTNQLILTLAFTLIHPILNFYEMVRMSLLDSDYKFYSLLENLEILFRLMVTVVPLISSAVKTVSSAKKMFEIGYEIITQEKILTHASKAKFNEFLMLKSRSKIYLGTAFYDIDWKLLFNVRIFLKQYFNIFL